MTTKQDLGILTHIMKKERDKNKTKCMEVDDLLREIFKPTDNEKVLIVPDNKQGHKMLKEIKQLADHEENNSSN